MMSERMNRVGAVACVALVVAQLLLMLLSWMISTAQPDSALHSLLSGEGIRWMVGHSAMCYYGTNPENALLWCYQYLCSAFSMSLKLAHWNHLVFPA